MHILYYMCNDLDNFQKVITYHMNILYIIY